MVALGAGDVSASQTAGAGDLDTLGRRGAAVTGLHGIADSLLHGAAESDTALQLRSDVLSNQLSVGGSALDLDDVEVDGLAGQLCQLLLDLGALSTDPGDEQDFEQTNYYTKKLLLWDYIAQGAVNVVVLLSLNQILSMYTLTPETRALAWTLVMIHNGMSIFLWPASFVLPNALRAANDVRFTMVVATASMLVWRMGLSWVLCVQMGMGAVGVWYAMVVDWICRIICFVARFVSGGWKKNAVKKAA